MYSAKASSGASKSEDIQKERSLAVPGSLGQFVRRVASEDSAGSPWVEELGDKDSNLD
jgi:hypothetical protein